MLLHHLGLPDEQVVEVPWADIDRTLEPDHLTALWVPRLAPPVGAELVASRGAGAHPAGASAPGTSARPTGRWRVISSRRPTRHSTPSRWSPPPSPTCAADDVAHLEEELGDLLFQVYFHALLATEEGHFTLADVARTLHDKLVSRHPHVFGDAVADTPEEVAARWEVLKKAEKGRASVTDGIPRALPALALVAKLQRKAESLGIDMGSLDDRRRQIVAGLERWPAPPRPASPGRDRLRGLGGDPRGPVADRRGAGGDALRPGRRGPAPGGRPRDGPAGLRGRVPPAHRGDRDASPG